MIRALIVTVWLAPQLWVWTAASAAAQSSSSAFDADAGPGDDDDGGSYTPASELRGLLATGASDRQAMKGVYFFPGEAAASNQDLYTAHPTLQSDQHWNSDVEARADVLDRMVAAHVNTVVMSFWGDDMKPWSPMELDPSSVRAMVEAVENKPLVVIPSLESGFDPSNPAGPHWRFSEDFPYLGADYSPAALAPSLLARLRTLVDLFKDRRSAWAQMYDREGNPRYVVHVLQAYAQHVPVVSGKTADQIVVEAFDAVAEHIYKTEGIFIGFTLDVTGGDAGSYSFTASKAGAALDRANSVLALHVFMSEARSGRVISSGAWDPPYDNNASNLSAMIDGKLQLLDRWRIAGLPVIYDVSSGFDGRFVWASSGTGFWGDNYSYTSDDWRNLESEHKDKHFIGINFNCWNGYTEGYAAVPTTEHGQTVYNWLSDLYSPDPRGCDHVEYVDGHGAYHVSGAVCEAWLAHGGRRGELHEPISDQLTTAHAQVAHFADGSIYANTELGAHAVLGAIDREYQRVGADASCLGLPISEQETTAQGLTARFEHGTITLASGAQSAAVSCTKD